MTQNDKSQSMAVLPTMVILFNSISGGAGTVAEWKLKDPLVSSPWVGALFLCLVGFMGLTFLSFSLRTWRSWGIIMWGYLLDFFLSTILFWHILDVAVADPLALWPYLLGTVATFIAAMIVGILEPRAPFRHGLGIVFVDLALSGVICFLVPNPLTLALISRVVAACGAACMGAAVGKYVRSVLRKESGAMRELARAIVIECIAATTSGLILAFFIT